MRMGRRMKTRSEEERRARYISDVLHRGLVACGRKRAKQLNTEYKRIVGQLEKQYRATKEYKEAKRRKFGAPCAGRRKFFKQFMLPLRNELH